MRTQRRAQLRSRVREKIVVETCIVTQQLSATLDIFTHSFANGYVFNRACTNVY